MAATAVQQQSAASSKTITWEEFKKRYLTREDAWKYEWVDGLVEKTPRSMDTTQLYILANLIRFLYTLKTRDPKISGDFIAEGDTFFAGNHRRPDIAYFSDAQIQAGRRNEHIHPDFVIEVISKNDQILKVQDKMGDYRKAGVKVIWHIFPKQQEIHVYHGKKMTVCIGDDICSAEPVIEGFVIAAKDVFK